MSSEVSLRGCEANVRSAMLSRDQEEYSNFRSVRVQFMNEMKF